MTLEHFRNLPEDKQQQIIDTAILEFVQFGYEGASTNRIVKEAGISKGVLFKYFTSKEKLFLFLCQYVAEKRNEWLAGSNQLPQDFFEILRFYALRDLEYVISNPMEYKFVDQVTRNQTHRVYQKAMEIFQQMGGRMFAAIMSVTPSEDLREGVTMEDAMNLILWVFNGFNQSMKELVNENFEQKKGEVLIQLDKVFELLKYGICKR